METGLAAYLLGIETPRQASRDPLRGNIFENIVVLEAMKAGLNDKKEPNLFYMRTEKGVEVDLILREVEVKASYKVTNFSNVNGSVSAANAYYEEGETVSLSTMTREKYFFESVSYTDKDGTHEITPDKGSYSFVMPASAVTLSATIVTHIHDWTYTADGATLTAACSGSGTCDVTDTTLTIQAPELKTQGGSESAEATLSAKSLAGQDVLPVIHYARKNSDGTYENLQAAPTDAGSYKAYITVDSKGEDVTAYVDYTIESTNVVNEVITTLMKTGDMANLGMYVLFMLVAAGAIYVVVAANKKKRS